MPKTISDQEIKSLSVYVDPELYDAIAHLARKNKRSLSQQAAFMLEELTETKKQEVPV